MTGFVAGVDGGATASRVVFLDPSGREVGRGEGPPAAVDPRRPEEAAEAVQDLVRRAAERAGIAPPLAGVWAGLAGAGREPARAAVEERLAASALAARVRVGTDVDAAFHQAVPQGPGILLVAGTGSMARGRAEDGREARTGGWGALLGDEGSGYAVGLDALRSLVRSRDGRDPGTQLTAAILRALSLEGEESLVEWCASATKGEVAALVSPVVETARRGDSTAQDILRRAVGALEEHVQALLEVLGPWGRPPEVCLAGGLVHPGGPLRDPLAAALGHLPIRLREEAVDGALGAARLARTLADDAPV